MLYAVSAFSQLNNFEPLLRIGDKVPDFKLTSTDNNTVSLSDYKGGIVVLDFWYIGCAPCVKAHKQMMEVQKEIGNNSFEILGMNSINRKGQIRRFVRKNNYTNTNLYCSKEVAEEYLVKYYPTIYIINKEGVIIYANTAFTPAFKQNFKEILQIEIQNNIIQRKTESNKNNNPFNKVFKK